jgi:hypothetical protein
MSDLKKLLQRIAGWDLLFELIALLVLTVLGILAYVLM